MTTLGVAQRVALLLGGTSILAGFLASIGYLLLAPLGLSSIFIWIGALVIVAVVSGICSGFRLRTIEQLRWQVVADTALTSGERQTAHREAESERRWALLSFLLLPLGFGYWLGGQPTERGSLAWAPAAGLVVYLLAWWLTSRRVEGAEGKSDAPEGRSEEE